ncbi:pentatricopeptide repeat-containing protein [Dorcoceras hygrometricum]|uniref:Pentatricopeptide repeat-containing protein n=1 Tax=Dorcoceras hygrometricum TaxID=472368 RepID=A0A2Z7D530_9LAMI|nr:pentatricopeptide repeat-containing protein [Dorcoceras hygrometricum]
MVSQGAAESHDRMRAARDGVTFVVRPNHPGHGASHGSVERVRLDLRVVQPEQVVRTVETAGVHVKEILSLPYVEELTTGVTKLEEVENAENAAGYGLENSKLNGGVEGKAALQVKC